MTPAAVEFQSSVTVKTSSQNPNSNPNLAPFASVDDLSQNQPQSSKANPSMSFGSGSEFGFGIGGSVSNGAGFASHTGSRVGHGRSRPRLMKMRKQMGRSRAGACESASGFNPFVTRSTDSSSISNGTLGVALSDKAASENTDAVSNGGSLSGEYSSVSKENVSFVFGAVNSDARANSYWQEHHSVRNQEKPVPDDACELRKGVTEVEAETVKIGSVFGPNLSKFGIDLNLETGEYSDCVEEMHSGIEEKVRLENEAECRSGCNSKFQSGATENYLNSENVKKPASENVNFVFGIGQRDFQLGLDPMKTEANRNEGVSGFGFVFGGSGSNSVSDCNSEKNDCNGNGNLDSDGNCKSRFVTSLSIATDSCTNTAFKLSNEMQKLNIDVNQNGDGFDKKSGQDKNSGANPDTIFFFGSPDLTNVSISGPSRVSESNTAYDFENCGNDHNTSRSGCNLNNGSDGSFCSEPFAFQAELGKNFDADLFNNSKVTSDSLTNLAAALDSFSNKVSEVEATSTTGVQKNGENSPKNTLPVFGSFTEPTTPKERPFYFGANLFPELNKKPEYDAKSKPRKDQRLKKTRGKLKQSTLNKQGPKLDLMHKQSDGQVHLKSPECYSPMDFSPYMETTVSCQPLKEISLTSNNETHVSDVNACDQHCRQPYEGCYNKSSLSGDYPLKGSVFGVETAYSSFKLGQTCFSGADDASVKDADGLKTESHASEPPPFASVVEDRQFFTFSSSSTSKGGLALRRRLIRKKNKKELRKDSFIISPNPKFEVPSSVQFSPHSDSLHSQGEDKGTKQGSVSYTPAFEEVCEMWRLRGNEAYKKGNLSEAEDLYTQGIDSVPLTKTKGCCLRPLVLCYSNRAATRISLGRMREALNDCVMAAEVDPNFLKVYVRAANCHLVLGEIENAVQFYNKLLDLGSGVCLDRRVTLEAADGLQKAQKVAECTIRSTDLLERKTSEAASIVLEIVAEALSVSSCSEKLLELKAEALCMLQKYEEAIQLCEQSLHVAEKNFPLPVTDGSYSLARLWRWRMISKSYFCMGRLEAALDILQKLEQGGSVQDTYRSQILESSTSLATTIRELLRCKNAGNEAVKSGKYAEAVEHYTVALSSNVESRPFAAICFCNRAAAHQALGNIADAIADCSLAMALDASYTKAVSRRASLHEIIRDYTQAANDIQRLKSILEHQSDDKTKQSGSQGRSARGKEIRQALKRLSLMEEEAKKGVPLDLYRILGVKASDAAADIKKAYRKAALRHHPDKAGQFLAKIESGYEGRLWKEIAQDVQMDADRLFKMIGEAYAILSDTTKRSEYDLEEEMRKTPKECYGSNPCYRRQSDAFRRSGGRQYWQENWKTYGYSSSRW